MNYYEHHIGDYAQATAHLSILEDGAYIRCIRKYYADEKPLPADIAAVQRLVGARTREERQAVETVVREFFTLEEDGWHNKRCDEEIAKFRESEPDREAKRDNERERQRRTRERRKQLFDTLRAAGVVPAYDAAMSELQRLVSQVESRPVTPPVTCDDTATQTPVPSHQLKDLVPSGLAGNVVSDAWRCPPCPHEEIVRIYGEELPQLPRCIALNDARRSHIGARWRQVCCDAKFSQSDGLEWFRDFFRDVSRSKFLTGNGTAGKDGRIFRADLEWLMNSTNFLKVFEGRYHPERATA